MKTIMTKAFLLMLMVFVVASCSKDKMEGNLITDSDLVKWLYSNTVDTLTIDGQTLTLDAPLYRDFFPGGPIKDNSNRLVAPLYLVEIDNLSLIEDIRITRMYAINGDQLWVAGPEEVEDAFLPDFKKHFICINGPNWDGGTEINVVVSVEDDNTREDGLLIARGRRIEIVE